MYIVEMVIKKEGKGGGEGKKGREEFCVLEFARNLLWMCSEAFALNMEINYLTETAFLFSFNNSKRMFV